MRIFGRKRDDSRSARDYDEAYLGLREQVLGLSPDQLGLDASPEPAVIAVLMETRYPEAVATLIGVVDGATSLYFSNGGGVIGAGEHPEVAEATRLWLQVCDQQISRLSATSESLPPTAGLTQFVAVTSDGLLSAVAQEHELGAGNHDLSPLFHAGQNVITQIRLLDEKRS